MLNITKVNNSIKVEGLDNKQFPDNGTLMIPLNSVILTLDESNIATFRSAANNDVLFSGVITDIQIAGSTVTKQTITTAFTAIANSSGGGSSYTAGDNINITNDVISVDIDDEKKVIASALVELHNDKADKNQLNNYQLKGNYVEKSAVDASIAAAVANYRTEAEALNVEKVDAAALNDLDKRVTALETAVGNISSVLDAINGETI